MAFSFSPAFMNASPNESYVLAALGYASTFSSAADLMPSEGVYLDPASARRIFEETDDHSPKEKRPYYRLQREFSGKIIVESLRFTEWKLRPAARLLGISPVKLRQDFRCYLETIIAAVGSGGEDEVAAILDMPQATLRRKLDDLGIALHGTAHSGGSEGVS